MAKFCWDPRLPMAQWQTKTPWNGGFFLEEKFHFILSILEIWGILKNYNILSKWNKSLGQTCKPPTFLPSKGCMYIWIHPEDIPAFGISDLHYRFLWFPNVLFPYETVRCPVNPSPWTFSPLFGKSIRKWWWVFHNLVLLLRCLEKIKHIPQMLVKNCYLSW